MADTDDRFLEALLAAEELEKLGFELNALRPDQVEQLSDKFDLPPERRQQLLAAIAAKMGSDGSEP